MSSEVTRLIVVRHGNTFNSGDIICRVGSATDIPLTETGMKQAYAAGEMIAELGFVPEVIFHAPLQRTCQSAVGVAASFPEVKLEEAEFLSELDYGNDDGKPEDEVVLRIGIVENSAAITPDTTIDELRAAGKAALKKWDSEAVLPKAWYFLAERAGELEKQWQDFAAVVLEKYHGKTVVAVTSNGIARFSKAILPEGVNLDGSLKLATGAFGIYEYNGRHWESTQWNLRPQVK
ncbi:MAG: histidine phosphatase family protein [Lentisphaeria bacterium]|nr:histidine phosphatase family protein [Lentisphaeria bacterium]